MLDNNATTIAHNENCNVPGLGWACPGCAENDRKIEKERQRTQGPLNTFVPDYGDAREW